MKCRLIGYYHSDALEELHKLRIKPTNKLNVFKALYCDKCGLYHIHLIQKNNYPKT